MPLRRRIDVQLEGAFFRQARALMIALSTDINEFVNQALEFGTLYGFALARA